MSNRAASSNGNGGRQVRLREVARAARVSVSTASRALQNNPRISERTRARVIRHAERLDYRANLVARSLSMRQTFTVGFIVLDVGNPFFADLAHGLDAVLKDEGYVYLLGDAHGQASRQREIAHRLIERSVDGLLLTVPFSLEVLRNREFPIVCIGRAAPGIPYVSTDHVAGGQLATKHLLDQGYKRIGLLHGEPTLTPVIDRRRGYRSAIDSGGHERLEVVCRALSYEAAYEGSLDLLQRGADAIFAISDTMAAAAMAAVIDSGKQIGRDIGIVGYDDLPMAAWPLLRLTSVAQDANKIGQIAGKMILERIRSPRTEMAPVTLAPRLVVRSSSSRTRASS